MTAETKACSCCSGIRKSSGKPPRLLIALPEEILEGKMGRKRLFAKKLQILVCPFCDGDVSADAVRASTKRIESKP